MSASKFQWERRVFEDVRGNLREIVGCSILDLDRFRDYLELLQDAIAQAPTETDFRSLYAESHYVRQLVHRCLEICGIEPSWVSLDMMVQLLHHQTAEDGGYRAGLLIEMMFPHKARKETKGVEFKEWVADSITLLVGLGLAPDLGRAIEIANSLSADQMETLILARLNQLDPKAKQRRDIQEAAEKLVEEPEKLQSMLDFRDVQWRDDINLNDFT